MERTKTIITALIIFGAVALCGTSGAEIVERIVAVVGDRIILASELANQVQMYLMSQGQSAKNMDIDKVSNGILTDMVNDALILSAAKDDTSITVSDAEITNGLNEHIASLASRFPSEEVFVEQLRQEGYTKRSLEKRYRPEIRDQLLKQKIINRKLSSVNLSRQEVEQFYHDKKDSLPERPSNVRLAHILIKYKVSQHTEDSVREMAEAAREKALEGEDFAQIALKFADMSPGVVGGRIGIVRSNEVVPEFGRAAFNLQPGAISGTIRTEYGWHIIKSHARYTDSADVSQILFPVAPSHADSVLARQKVDSLYKELLNGADFPELAKANSDDDASRGTGGELDVMTLDQIRPEFVEPLSSMEIDDISTPIESALGFHILKLISREDSRPLDLTEDYEVIRNIARQEKTNRLVEDWVAELKKRIYVDIRPISLK